MNNPTNRLFCRLDGLNTSTREQKRVQVLKNLGLLEPDTVPIFDEVTQTTASFLEVPICSVGIMVEDKLWLKSAVGLSHLGFMNEIAQSRKIPKRESFDAYVVDSQNCLVINDTTLDSIFARSLLVQHHGVLAYLGAPLITSDGHCLGSLSVMDTHSRNFTAKDIEFLSLTARWCVSEFERNRLVHNQATHLLDPLSKSLRLGQTTVRQELESSETITHPLHDQELSLCFSDQIKVKLLTKLTQELRTPLTSVMGMARVLQREVYGPLTGKQKEYTEIIHTSGQHLLSLVEEIVNLGIFGEEGAQLQVTPVDIEMLSQQAVNSLTQLAEQQRQEIRLSVEPGNHIWLLDKEKIRQMLYYLLLSVIETAETGSEVRIHVSRKNDCLHIAVWVSHPWLGDGLPPMDIHSSPLYSALSMYSEKESPNQMLVGQETVQSSVSTASPHSSSSLLRSSGSDALNSSGGNQAKSREMLGLLLSCHLAELHGGEVAIQGSLESGYRYVVKLPQMKAEQG